MDLVDLAFAEAERGMNQALAHAEQVETGWGDVAYLFLQKYAREHAEPFTALDVRTAASAWGLSDPPTPKAFGGVFQRASRAGVIRKIGYAPHAERHASPTVLWSRA